MIQLKVQSFYNNYINRPFESVTIDVNISFKVKVLTMQNGPCLFFFCTSFFVTHVFVIVMHGGLVVGGLTCHAV